MTKDEQIVATLHDLHTATHKMNMHLHNIDTFIRNIFQNTPHYQGAWVELDRVDRGINELQKMIQHNEDHLYRLNQGAE